MAELIKIENAHDGYREVLKTVLDRGTEQTSRLSNTLEVRDLITEIADPRYYPLGVRPNYNSAVGLAEGVMLVAGMSDPAIASSVAPALGVHTEPDTGRFWAPYGERTGAQMSGVVRRLRETPDTRQAVVTLWDPAKDLEDGHRDYPCNSALTFLRRDGRLYMTLLARSNDMWMGAPYDYIQFQMLQAAVAACLEVEAGTLTYHAVSGHLYKEHWDLAREVVESDGSTLEKQPVPVFGVGDHVRYATDRWAAVQREAFEAYMVVGGLAPFDSLHTAAQTEVALKLLRAKAKVASRHLDEAERLVWHE